MYEIKIRHAHGTYAVHGERGGLGRAGALIRAALPEARRAFVVTDEHIRSLYLKPLAASLANAAFEVSSAILTPGEEAKNTLHLSLLYRAMLEGKVNRSDVVVALGGGSLSDVTGFAAATFKRGVPWAVVPTTLLAQVDAAVGGKVGVDFDGVKNQVGTFYQPAEVVVDGDLLATLPAKQLAAGMAETVKYAVLTGPDFFADLENNLAIILRAGPELDGVVERALRLKGEVISSDERDVGRRHLLNLGHTFGHAFEAVSRFTLSHGEGVAIGLVYTCLLAELLGLMATEEVIRVAALLRRCNLPICLPSLYIGRVIEAIKADKKITGQDIYMAVPHGIGKVLVDPIPLATLSQLLPQIHHLARQMK